MKTGPLRCPRCETNLAPYSVGKNSLCMCSGCGGLWVDKTVFQSICTREEEQEAVLTFQPELLKTASTPERKPQRAYIPCPECGKLMNHKNFSGSGTVLDWCRDHGSWFDRNELQQIVQFIKDGGLRKAREKEIQRLKEEQENLRMQEFTLASLERRFDSRYVSKVDDLSTGDALLQFVSNMFAK